MNAQDLRTETEGCVERVEVDGDAKPVPCRVIVAPPCMPTKSGAAEFRTIATVTWLADAVLGFARPYIVVKTSTECVPATAEPTVHMIWVAVQLETKHAAEPSSTELLADHVPKPLPVTVNVVPIEMMVGFTELMLGVMAALESYLKRKFVVTEYMTVVVVG